MLITFPGGHVGFWQIIMIKIPGRGKRHDINGSNWLYGTGSRTRAGPWKREH